MNTNNQSLILTIHNKDFLINEVLYGIKANTTGNYELIVVLDGCTDNTEKIVRNFKKENSKIKTEIIETPDVFETMANNAGLRHANSEISIIIQDDMVIKENGWNNRITKPFRDFNDVFGVTANCAHNWEFNPKSKHRKTKKNNNYEWCDILNHVDHANRDNTARDTFSIRQCVNRGPLALNHSDLVSLDYFDESFAPQDMDDHDLCFRMQKELGKVVGCYWIDYICNEEWGGTRASGKPAPWVLEANQKNTKIVVKRHKKRIKKKILIDRKC